MKISVDEEYDIVLEEVFNPVVLKTEAGESLGVCMRDSGFELIYVVDGKRKNVSLKNGAIDEMDVDNTSIWEPKDTIAVRNRSGLPKLAADDILPFEETE